MTEPRLWRPKSSGEIAEDKKQVHQGKRPIILLSTREDEKKSVRGLIDALAKRKPEPRLNYYCHQGRYRINGNGAGAPDGIPKEGLIYRMNGFPITVFMETAFEKRLFIMEPETNTAQSWKFKWIGRAPSISEKENGEGDVCLLSVYPDARPVELRITDERPIHDGIRPTIYDHAPIPVETDESVDGVRVELHLLKSESLQKMRVKELERELNVYENFANRWEKIDLHSLKNQEERAKALELILRPLLHKQREYQKIDQFSLRRGEELHGQIKDHIGRLKGEIEMLSGKAADRERLICIPADNRAFYEQLVTHPLPVLRSIYFLPVHLNDVHCHLLRIGGRENDNPLFQHFMDDFHRERKSLDVIYEFRPDVRWIQFGIRLWTPLGYTLEPYFFSYQEKEEALEHLKKMLASLFRGEEDSDARDAFIKQLETGGDRPLELVFIPPFGSGGRMKTESPPGVMMLDKREFYRLADHLKLVNDTQAAKHQECFESLYEQSMKDVFKRFHKKDFLQNWLARVEDEEKRKKFRELKGFLPFEMTELLNDDFQRHLFNVFDAEVLERARGEITKKTEETGAVMKKEIARVLDDNREKLTRQIDSEFEGLRGHYMHWLHVFRDASANFKKFDAEAEAMLSMFMKKWREKEHRWRDLIKKPDKLAEIEQWFRKTEIQFNRLVSQLSVKLLYGIFIILVLVGLGVLLWLAPEMLSEISIQ